MIGMSSIGGQKVNNYDNSSPAIYQFAAVDNVSVPIDAGVLGTSSAKNSNESFVQSVLQSLQNLGLNTTGVNTNDISVSDSSSNSNDVLQVFVQDLYKALTQGNVQLTDNTVSNVAPAVDSTVEPVPTIISGGTNFKYVVDLSQADLGENLANVESNIKTALDNIGQYISSKAVFNLKVLTEYAADTSTLAGANATLSVSKNNPNTVDTTFVADSIRGVDSDPNVPDSTLYINLAKMNEMSFSGTPATDKFDLVSILTHEILHGLAFTGNLDGNNAPLTGYDELVTTQNADSTFEGRHAQTANAGNPVPLSSATAGKGSAYYHVALPNDLMAASIRKGEVKSISPLDVAMLEDMGLTVTGASPTSAANVKNAYNTPSNTTLQNLMNSVKQNDVLQADFSNLVQSLGGSPSTANLHNFLAQLSASTDNGNLIPNGSGSLFSATA